MSFVDSTNDANAAGSNLADTVDKMNRSTSALGVSTTAFANAMRKAFTDATIGGKQFDDVLKSLALRLSSLAVAQAFKPFAKGVAGGFGDLFGGLLGGGSLTAPMSATMPLSRGPDGALGAGGPSAPPNVTVQIATPDAASFRRSEAYITGQIARAVARGQRSM
jgi:phage-related minor tail protein